MSTSLRVAAFVTALVAVFVAALGAGRVLGPVDVAAASGEHADGHAGASGGHDDGQGTSPAADHVPGGLMVADGGYRLVLEQLELPPRREVPLRFRIIAADGEPLTSYDVEHEKELHLILVRRDLGAYHHLHPVRGADGFWATDVTLTPGSWRVFADFVPRDGEPLTLGADLGVPGLVRPAPSAPRRTRDTVDGYTVSVTGDLEGGESSELTVSVRRDGEDVSDLEPYLGAFGHLVALREGDLAYLHVHPEEAGPGPDVPFVAEVPTDGGYRLFFDFKHDGRVRTATFAVSAGIDPQERFEADEEQEEDESHDH